MESKVQQEYKALIKLGIPENMAYLIASHKYGQNTEEVNILIQDVKEQQVEIQNCLKEFKPFEKVDNLNLTIDNVENKDKTV